MELKDIKAVYFVGAGGIGMSAIARYFIKKGLVSKPRECSFITKRMLMRFHTSARRKSHAW